MSPDFMSNWRLTNTPLWPLLISLHVPQPAGLKNISSHIYASRILFACRPSVCCRISAWCCASARARASASRASSSLCSRILRASVPSSIIVSLNHGCLRACLAVIRCLGSYTNIFLRRSRSCLLKGLLLGINSYWKDVSCCSTGPACLLLT